MISRFVVFGCHGNMDFCKITIMIIQFRKTGSIRDLSPAGLYDIFHILFVIMIIVSGKDFTSVSTKESLLIVVENLRYGPQKTVSKHVNLRV